MSEMSAGKRYALELYNDDMTVLLPLSYIGSILPYSDMVFSDAHTVVYQERRLPCFYLEQVMSQTRKQNVFYAVLLQNEDIEAFLFVQKVCGIQELQEQGGKLPAYLQARLTYIQECHLLDQERLAYLLNIRVLLEQHGYDNEKGATYETGKRTY